jgi:MFS family permease
VALDVLRRWRRPSGSAGTGGSGGAVPFGRNFDTFQVTMVFSDLADGIYRVALPLLALTLTRDPVLIGLIAFAGRLPWLVAALPAGVAVDRFRPHRVIGWAVTGRFLALVALAGLTMLDLLPLWLLVVGAFFVGSAGTTADIAAQTLVPKLVDKAALTRANSRLQAIQTGMALLIGPALAGVVQLAGLTGSFLTIGALFAVALVSVTGVQVSEPVVPGGAAAGRSTARESLERARRDLREGFAYFRRRHDLVWLAVAGATANFTFICLHTVLPLWAVDPGPLEMRAEWYPVLVGALAVGGLVATPVVPRVIDRIGSKAAVRLAPALLGLAIGTVAIRSVWAAIAGQFLCGVAIMLWNVVNATYRQKTVDGSILGRVNGVYRWITWGVMPLAALASGFISDWIGYRTLFLWSAGILIGLVVFTEPGDAPPVPPSSKEG